VIGINKVFSDAYPVYITPNFDSARVLVEAGADIIALDCTPRSRDGEAPEVLIRRIRDELGAEVFADISTLEEGIAAEQWGATYISTTLAGYTEYTTKTPGPDLDLVRALAARVKAPIVAEGRYNTPELARAAIDAGAYAVVVGTMITNPREITKVFAKEVLGA
jgi:N-acylglucosamine-6-phosphate 2-epimerase/N-acetylmuramic acid 6-phosphate etherase